MIPYQRPDTTIKPVRREIADRISLMSVPDAIGDQLKLSGRSREALWLNGLKESEVREGSAKKDIEAAKAGNLMLREPANNVL